MAQLNGIKFRYLFTRNKYRRFVGIKICFGYPFMTLSGKEWENRCPSVMVNPLAADRKFNLFADDDELNHPGQKSIGSAYDSLMKG